MDSPLATLRQILNANQRVTATWFDDPDDPSELTILTDDLEPARQLKLPEGMHLLRVNCHVTRPLNILRCPETMAKPFNTNQECQDEPIQLGTQIQPQGASWVGTAGAPVRWLDLQGDSHHGILSNWHVLADGDERPGRTQHQPDSNFPAIAALTRWAAVEPYDDNFADCAIADALIDGRHTISDEVLHLGSIGTAPLNATVGLKVAKSGRTTGLTTAVCTAVGASVRVGYGDFAAAFHDQDVFSPEIETFSAPGDSGSLIVGRSCHCPTSLLFAGSADITIGNPIRYVAAAMSLRFPFN